MKNWTMLTLVIMAVGLVAGCERQVITGLNPLEWNWTEETPSPVGGNESSDGFIYLE